MMPEIMSAAPLLAKDRNACVQAPLDFDANSPSSSRTHLTLGENATGNESVAASLNRSVGPLTLFAQTQHGIPDGGLEGRTMNASLLLLCLLQFPTDPVRANEQAIANLTTRKPVILQKPEMKQFEERFNHLVQAVSEFSIAYNKNKGHVWPADKAEALRRAMSDLQKAERNLKPLKKAKRNSTKPSTQPQVE